MNLSIQDKKISLIIKLSLEFVHELRRESPDYFLISNINILNVDFSICPMFLQTMSFCFVNITAFFLFPKFEESLDNN